MNPKTQFDPQRTWFTSDIHFGHKNIMKYCATTRPYCSVSDMDGTIVEDWNATVGPDDTVFYLGDFAFHKLDKTLQILKALNGRKILIYGNHDQVVRNNKSVRDLFDETHEYMEITHDKTKICMFHYPMEVWNRCHHGSIHLHGHSHGELPDSGEKRFDMGWDVARKIFSLQDIMDMADLRPSAKHHRKDCKLTLVRGIPGSGKSTYVETHMNPTDKEAFFEADMYFMNDAGDYNFNKDMLHRAHEWCFTQTREALEAEKNTVVANTFTTAKEMKQYVQLARTLGTELKIIDVRGNHKSIHDVPEETIERMRNRWFKVDDQFINDNYIDGNKRVGYSELVVDSK